MLDGLTGPLALFWFCLLSGILVPMPEDVALLFAGLQIGGGHLSWGAAIGAAMLGVFLRDTLFFGVGHLAGESLLRKPWVVRILGAHRIEAARSTVARRGGAAVLIGRLSIGVRTSMFLVAGALGVRPRQFAFWDALGLMVTVPLWLLAGRFIGQPAIDAALWTSDRAAWVAIPIVALVAAVWFFRRSTASEADVVEVPS